MTLVVSCIKTLVVWLGCLKCWMSTYSRLREESKWPKVYLIVNDLKHFTSQVQSFIKQA